MIRKFFFIFLLLIIPYFIFSEEIEFRIVEHNKEETSFCSIHVIDLSLSDEVTQLQRKIEELPYNYQCFFTPTVSPAFVGDKTEIFSTNNIQTLFFGEDYLYIYLSNEETNQLKNILEDENNYNKFITLIINDHALGVINTNACYKGNNMFLFIAPINFITDSYINKSHLSAKLIIDARKQIKSFIDIPFNSSIIETIKILDKKKYDYKVFHNEITINEQFQYLGKTITKCTLLFLFNKLYYFEISFEDEFENEPTFDVYIQKLIKNFRMKKNEDYPSSLANIYESFSGISLFTSILSENTFSLYDKFILDTAHDISNNDENPLGYSKWNIARFRMLASENINKQIMFENIRIYNISEDGNSIKLIDYYDNFLNAKLNLESKNEEIIERILYLLEQRETYHSANCFADFYGHIELDQESNNPIFCIEMID